MLFDKKRLIWTFYTNNETLLNIKQVQLINPKEFVIAALDVSNEIFEVYVAIQKWEKIPMYYEKQAHIEVGALIFDEASIEILVEYFNYSAVFLAGNIVKLPKNTKMNEHAI